MKLLSRQKGTILTRKQFHHGLLAASAYADWLISDSSQKHQPNLESFREPLAFGGLRFKTTPTTRV